MADPVSDFTVGIAVINVIGKFIDNTWTQAQAHQLRLDENKVQHQFRLDENKAQHKFRLKELQKQYEQSIIKAYLDSEIRVNEQQIIEQIKSSYAISTNKVLKDSARDDANSPFYDGIEETYKNLKALHEKTHLPIVLVSPFWDDTKSKELNDKGGYVDFLNAFNTSYSQAPWHTLAHRESGYFKRPLYQTERDINYIYSVLSDIPIILVHGTIQGVHSSDQRVQRIHPQITFWNLFPDQQDSYTSLNFKFVPLQLPTVNDESTDIYQKMGEYSLNFQDFVGKNLAKGIGFLSSFYHLYHFETRPNLQQFQLENDQELELLCFQMSEFYEFLAQKQPSKMKYYINEKKLILAECGINETTMRKNSMKDQYSTVELDATAIRSWFATQLAKIAQILTDSEKQAQKEGTSGELALSAFIDNLNREVDKLRKEKFRFLIIGDFNRGKSSILNVLFGQELLPMGVTATTSIPTVVKHGKEQKVIVHKKDGTEENLSLEGYKNKYTLNSKDVKDKIKRIYNSVVGGWLKDLDFADFYCPVDLLSKGIEFIDTAGLNHTDDEDKKTLAYIPECHAIFFVLSAEQQLTAKEKEYLNKHIKDKVGTVFFLINKWELVKESDKEEVHNAFVDGLSECLQIEQSEVEKMWGYTVFDVYTQTALKRLAEHKHLDGTGFIEFSRRLDDFLIHERLTAELLPSVQIAISVTHQVAKLVDERLLILNETVKSLEEKIKKANPYIDVMKRIVKNLKAQTQIQKDACIREIRGAYQSYFAQILNKIDSDFQMPSISGLKDNQKEEYKKLLEKKFQEYQQEKLNGWKQISEGIVTKTLLDLTNLFQEDSKEYDKKRKEIQEILSGKDFNFQNPTLSTYETNSTGNISLAVIKASATRKMILAGGGTTVGTVIAGVGAANIANLAGAQILLGTIGTSLALTPIGWGLLAIGAAGGGLAAWWGRRSEIEKFQKGMKEQIKKALATILEPDKVLGIQENVGTLFVGFEDCAKELKDDIESLETSLNNLLESKKTKEFDSQAEAKRLQELQANIYTQWEDINAEYTKIAPAK